MNRIALLVLGSVLSLSCALDVAEPHSTLDGLPAGLEVEYSVEPGEVEQYAPFIVRMEVTNTTTEPITVITAHSCLVIPGVYRHSDRVPFRGSDRGCRAAITTHTFDPGETKENVWEMRAELYAEHPGEADGAPAPVGTYDVRTEFDMLGPTDRNPVVTAKLRVR